MRINDLELPALFVDHISAGRLKRRVGSWQLIGSADAYGNPLETELGEVFDTVERLEQETKELPNGFEANGYYGKPHPDLDGPGAIPDIVDFSEIVCFAICGDGSPFCFDYREIQKYPSVIWWDDVYWRRLAPDYSLFIKLFNLKRIS